MYSHLPVCQVAAQTLQPDTAEFPQQAQLTNSDQYPCFASVIDPANEPQMDKISIYDAEQQWKENQGHESEHIYRRHVVGRAFELDYDEPRIRETHTGTIRTIERPSWQERREQARNLSMIRPRSAGGSVTGLSVVETIEHDLPEATRSENSNPSTTALPAWASGRLEDFSWSDEEDEDLGIYATAGSKQRSYDVPVNSDYEDEGESTPEPVEHGVAPAFDVSEAATPPAPSQTDPTSPTNTSTKFTLDADDIECQLLEDPSAFRTYIEDLNTKLQHIISSTSSAEHVTKEVLEQAEDAYQKRIGEQATIEKELRKQIAQNEADLKQFKEELHKYYKSKYDTEVRGRDDKIESLYAKIGEQRIVIEHNSSSTTNFHYKEKAKAVAIAEEKLRHEYSVFISDLKASNLELKEGWKTLKDERDQVLSQWKSSEARLCEARAFINDSEADYIQLRSDKERLEAEFAAERQNLTHLELVNEELELSKEKEIAAKEAEMAGTRAAKEKEIAAIRGEMKDLKDEIEFKDEQLVQLADLTINEVELKEKVRDLQAQVAEKDQQSAMLIKLEEEKRTALAERDQLQAQLSNLTAQLTAQASITNDNNQLEACEVEKQELQAEIIELHTKVAALDNELTLSFIQAEELATLKVEHKKLQDELKQAKESATASITPVPRSERLQNALTAVSKMRERIENRPPPYVCMSKIRSAEERRADYDRLFGPGAHRE